MARDRLALRAPQRGTAFNPSAGKRPRRLLVESLEDRSLMAAVASGLEHQALPAVAAPAALVDDPFEENDRRLAAANLGTASGSATFGQLALADGNDWYRFNTTRLGTASDNVAISFLNAQGNLNLQLYNSAGQRLRISHTLSNTERISLSALPAATYFVRVFGVLGATNPNYALSLNVGQALADDAYEQNDTAAVAKDFGTLTAPQTYSNLVMADGIDWYRFSMNAAGTTSDFVAINFQHVQGNLTLRLYTGSGLMVGSSATTSNLERISLAGLAAGSYFVQVVGANGATNPNYSLQIDPGVTTSSPPPSSSGAFDIQLSFTGMTASQRTIFERAAQKWESVIVGELPNATFGGVAVDDLLIRARSVAIDGRGNILGQAGPDRFRSSTGLPYVGTMEFDSADMASMEANGTLYSVILHEMGHVLGIGTLWSSKGLILGEGTSNPRFVGPQAVAAYNTIFGGSFSSVPVENSGGPGTRDGHWRESVFSTELMTGWVGPGTNNPLSRVTVGSLADLGYTVNYAAADPYPRSGSQLSSMATTASFGSAQPDLLQLVNSKLPAFASQNGEHHLSRVRVQSDSGPIVTRASQATASQARRTANAIAADNPKAVEAAVDALLADWLALDGELWEGRFHFLANASG